ncbi:hypothetical protein Tco_0145095 [Tanacetum coccineum]
MKRCESIDVSVHGTDMSLQFVTAKSGGYVSPAGPIIPVVIICGFYIAWLEDENYNLCRTKEISLDYNNSFLGEYECSSLALDREEMRDEKKRLDHLKQDQTMLVIKRFRERKKTEKIRAKKSVFQLGIMQYLYAEKPNVELCGGEGDDKELVVIGEVGGVLLGGGDGGEGGRLMVVKEIEDGLVEEMEKLEWWFEQDINDERDEVKEDEDGGEV